MSPIVFRDKLCASFCGELTVREVPAGLAVSAMFEGSDGDRLGCLVEQNESSWRISDDGGFLSNLEGFGIEVRRGGRAEFLTRALRTANGFVDPKTLQIACEGVGQIEPLAVLRFFAALSRVQDVSFWTKERVRSTFKEDATAALTQAIQGKAELLVSASVDKQLNEFPADVVIRPLETASSNKVTAVFLVQAIETLQEALLLALELRAHQRRDIRVAALIEDQSVSMGSIKATRAINRIDAFSVFRNDEREAAFRIARTAIPDLSILLN